MPSLRRAGAVLGAFALAGSVLSGAEPAQADQSVPVPSSKTVTIIGRGWGHGRGMSQYGAYHAAAIGKTWSQIISFYYPSAGRVTRGYSTITVSIAGTSGYRARVAAEPGLTATDGTGQKLALPTTDPVKPTVAITGWQISKPSGGQATLSYWTSAGMTTYKQTTGATWTIAPSDATLTTQNGSGAPITTYIGSVRAAFSGTTVTPVLSTSLEAYTRMVVPYESPGSWPVNALGAQAVAARSYAAYFQAHPRSSDYQICDTTSCQVMGGINAETANSRQAVTNTAGVVLTTSTGAAMMTEFGSSNGGEIAPSSLGSGRSDPYDNAVSTSIILWRKDVSATTIQSVWPAVGTLTSVQVSQRDGYGMWGGRATQIVLRGTSGTVTVSGDTFRYRLGLKSTYLAVVPGPLSLLRDMTSDGVPDVLTIGSDGKLWLRPGRGAPSIGGPQLIGSSWTQFTSVAWADDFTGDRVGDVLALKSTGELLLYQGKGQGGSVAGFFAGKVIATGLTGYDSLVTLTNFTGNNTPTVLARRTSDGALVRFAATGKGTMSTTPTVISPSGWQGQKYSLLLGAGDITGDRRSDLAVRDNLGHLIVWKGTGAGTLAGYVQLAGGWNWYASIASSGDLTGDGVSDLIVTLGTGELRLVSTGTTVIASTPVKLGAATAGEKVVR